MNSIDPSVRSDDADPNTQRSLNEKLARGAGANALGTLAKVAIPLVFLVIARLYSPALLGAFSISTASTRFLESLLTSGFRDAMVMYGARYNHLEEYRERLYQGVANALVFSVGLSILAVLVVSLFPRLMGNAFDDPVVSRALQVGIFALPFTNLREISLSMIRSQMIMHYDAVVNGVVGPTTLLVFVSIGGFVSPGVELLMSLWVGVEVLTCVVAVRKAGRYFDWGRVLRTAARLKFDTELAWFALPQNLNSTFNYFVTSLDVVMLGLFGVSTELVGFYSIAARTLRELRSPRRSFAAVLSPLVARLHHENRLDELSYHFATTSRWALTITVPVAFALLVLLPDILRVVHPSYDHDIAFAMLLAVNPILAAGLGLAGNVLVMTGNSRVNLVNSLLAAASNVGLNWLLIPRWGLLGAAVATMVAGVFITVLQIIEAKILVGLRADLAALRKPVMAGLAALLPLALGTFWGYGATSLWPRLAYAVAGLAMFAGTLKLLGVAPEDRQMLADLFARQKAKAKQVGKG